MGGKGLRVLAFAARFVEESEVPALVADPMSFVSGLGFVGLVGIIDPLRPEAKAAVATAHRAEIDVRMITGDHTVTANAIGEALGLAPARVTQEEGLIVAMTGDAVNDAAAPGHRRGPALTLS